MSMKVTAGWFVGLLLALLPGAGPGAEAVAAAGAAPEIGQLQQRLQVVTAAHGEDAPALIDPLLDLARQLAVAEDYAQGYGYLNHARSIARRAGLPAGAGHEDRVRRFSLLRVQYANWLIGGRQHRAAGRLLKEAEADLSATFGREHHLLIAPLVSRAALYGARGYKLKERGQAFERALEIAWRSDGFEPREIVLLYLREGDFYIVHRKSERAHRSYRQAWKLLRESAGSVAETEALLGNPELLWISPWIPVARMPVGGAGRQVTIRAEVSVGRDGRVKQTRILTPDIDPGIARGAERVFFWSTFRPAMREGKVVVTEQHLIEREFELVLN